MHQSIPAVPIPPSPPGNRGAFTHVVSRGGGAIPNFIVARGLGISIPKNMCVKCPDEFIGKHMDFVKYWLLCQGLEKPVNVFKGMSSQF